MFRYVRLGVTPSHLGNYKHATGLIHMKSYFIVEGSFEVKLPTIWTDEKQSRAEAERRERLEERRSEKRKSQKKEDADVRKGRKSRETLCFSNDLRLRRVEK